MIKAGVAGAGVFGGHHARKYAGLDHVEMAAIYDHDLHHAERLAKPLNAQSFDDYAAFLKAVDIVTVATPAAAHAGLALEALRHGKHVYVEKPIATTDAAAAELVREASERGLVLACGHQERAVFEAIGLMDLKYPDQVLGVEAVRRGTPSERNRDVSCVLDLMIHDLDLAVRLAASPFVDVAAEGGFDEVRADVRFENGLTALFETSRIAEVREREMLVVLESGLVHIDFLTGRLHNESDEALDTAFADSPEGRDPLGASVRGFVSTVRCDRARPVVTGQEAAQALALALAIERAAGL